MPGVFATVGIHPHNAGERELPAVDEILREADHPRVIGIGESGLDYFYDKAPRDAQAASFRRHIAPPARPGLPLVIHARDADADMAAILDEETGQGPSRSCCTASPPARSWRGRPSGSAATCPSAGA
jgi:TatD DNase family protein